MLGIETNEESFVDKIIALLCIIKIGSGGLMGKVSYSLDDFETVIGLSYESIVLATKANSDYKSSANLKNAKEIIKYGSSGTRGLPHLSQATFFRKAGIEATRYLITGGEHL